MKILLVEDNPDHVNIIQSYLSTRDLDIENIDVHSSIKSLKENGMQDPDVILLDLNLSDSPGLDTLKEVRKYFYYSPIIVLTSIEDHSFIREALTLGAQDYVSKNELTEKVLVDSIYYSINRNKHRAEIAKSKDRELQNLKHHSDLLLKIVPSAVFTVDLERRITSWNAMAEKITGYTSQEVLGKECLVFADAPCNENCGLYNLSHTKPIIGTECTIRTKSGKPRYISKNVDCLYDDNGEISGGIESFQDITESKRTQLLHKVIYEINNAVFEYSDFHSLLGKIREIFSQMVSTKNFLVALYNNEAETLSIPFQTNEVDQYTEVPVKDTFTGYVIKTNRSLLLNEEKTNQMIKEGKAKMHGTPAKVWMGVPIRVRGEVFGVIVIQDYENENAFGYDELELLEFASDQIGSAMERIFSREDLEKSAQELKLANDTKDRFFSIISHDLKNPFLTLRGSLEILDNEFGELSNEEMKEIISALRSVSNSTFELLQDLLLWSRSQQNKLEINLEEVDIPSLINKAIEPLTETAKAKNVDIEVENNISTKAS